MSRKAVFWSITGGLFLLTIVLLVVRLTGEVRETPERLVPVEVEIVSKGDIEEIISATGLVEARAIVHVMPKVSGRLESLAAVASDGSTVRVEEGVSVGRGQQIGEIDRALHAAAASQAVAQVAAVRAEADDAERESRRMASLFESGSATAQMRDRASAAAQATAARLKAAEAASELAQINLRESVLRSPLDGVVTRRHIDEGNLVSVGQPVVTIADMAEVKVVVNIPDRLAAVVTEGMPCRLMVDAYPDKVFEAYVRTVYPALAPETLSLQVEIRLDNSKMKLKPGMFARVELVTAQKEDVVVLPIDAILGGKVGEAFVYVVEDGTARRRVVERGIIQADRVEITGGLDAGEQLVVTGMTYLKDEMKVEVISGEASQ
ncbi:MAG TPA: efflux RND transporter periplasmic adaptor subunit [Sedimentisphaerales bacterium]|nr:efflux RND transporter periplasmic adaptor subunit [Sedimentisphaerales bacterium]